MRLNRVAMDLGLTARKRPKKSQYIVAAPVAKKEKNAMFTTPLTFKDMENVVENRNQEERDFVVDTTAKETSEDHETEQLVSDVVDKVFDAKDDAVSAEKPAEAIHDASDAVTESEDHIEDEETAADTPSENDVGSESKKTGGKDYANEAAEACDEDTEMNENATENEEVVVQENVQDAELSQVTVETEKPEKSGYDLAMDLLRIIRDNSDEAVLKERYGSRWSLSGMIGTTFDDAKKMLVEVRDYFAFHVGEIVALVSNQNTVAGVVIFVDGDSIGVFDGEKILSYKSDMIVKTGKVFKSVMAAGGLNLQ